MWQQIPLAWPCVSGGIPQDPASGCCILPAPTHCHRNAHETQQLDGHCGRQSRFLSASWSEGVRKHVRWAQSYGHEGEWLHRIKYPRPRLKISNRDSIDEEEGQRSNSVSVNTRGPLYNKHRAMKDRQKLCDAQTWTQRKSNFGRSNN